MVMGPRSSLESCDVMPGKAQGWEGSRGQWIRRHQSRGIRPSTAPSVHSLGQRKNIRTIPLPLPFPPPP